MVGSEKINYVMGFRCQVSGVRASGLKRGYLNLKKVLSIFLSSKLIVGAVCSPEFVEGSTAIYSV
jgi:hypothetical protein